VIRRTRRKKNFAKAEPVIPAFRDVKTLSQTEATEIDLGGRTVKVVPRTGHTASDVTIEISDPDVIWTGDLYFNRVFPNYGDATPNLLTGFVEYMGGLDDSTVIVPGHGSIANQADVKVYGEFLKTIEDGVRKAYKAGKPAGEAAKEYKLPKELQEWFVWSPEVMSRAFHSWYHVLNK